MIEDVLPTGVRFAEAFDDLADPGWFAEEEAVVARAVDKRRREFGTVRRCARLAMTALGVPPVPLLPGPRGEPRWPAHVIGSMTHCAGYRGAVVARDSEFRALGIDAEPNEPLPGGVLEIVSLPGERAALAPSTAGGVGVCWDRLLFSAKESVYKAWYPLTRRELGFDGASITFTADPAVSDGFTGAFDARVLVPGPVLSGRRLGGFTGRWTVRRGLVLTAVALAAETAVDAGERRPDTTLDDTASAPHTTG